jgi:nitrate reductase assembly molybdenum cofactor insertion protein NarJ
MNERGFDRDAREALADAAAWRLLGLLLERPKAGWREQVETLARETHSQTLSAAARVARVAREGPYLALLGPGGSISPREIAYRGMEDPGHLLAEIASFYDAFAYRATAEDPVDHAAVEAGFVGYMQLKLAFALSRGDEDDARVVSAAVTRFLAEHVRYWAAPLAKRLSRSGASHLLLAAREIARRAGPAPVAPRGPWNVISESEPGSKGSSFCGGGCLPDDDDSPEGRGGFF